MSKRDRTAAAASSAPAKPPAVHVSAEDVSLAKVVYAEMSHEVQFVLSQPRDVNDLESASATLVNYQGALLIAGYSKGKAGRTQSLKQCFNEVTPAMSPPTICQVRIGDAARSNWFWLEDAVSVITVHNRNNMAEACGRVAALLRAIETTMHEKADDGAASAAGEEQDEEDQDEEDSAVDSAAHAVAAPARRFGQWLRARRTVFADLRDVATNMGDEHRSTMMDILLGLRTSARKNALQLKATIEAGGKGADSARKTLAAHAQKALRAVRAVALSSSHRLEEQERSKLENMVKKARKRAQVAETKQRVSADEEADDEPVSLSHQDVNAIREAGNRAAEQTRHQWREDQKALAHAEVNREVEDAVAAHAVAGKALLSTPALREALFAPSDPEFDALLDEMFRSESDALVACTMRLHFQQVVDAVMYQLHPQYKVHATVATAETAVLANLTARSIDGALKRIWASAAAVFQLDSFFTAAREIQPLLEAEGASCDLQYTPEDSPPEQPREFAWKGLETFGASFDPLKRMQEYLDHASVSCILDMGDESTEQQRSRALQDRYPITLVVMDDGRKDAWMRTLFSIKCLNVRNTALSSHGTKTVGLADSDDHVVVLPHGWRIWLFMEACEKFEATLIVEGLERPINTFTCLDGVAAKEQLKRSSALANNCYVHADAPKETKDDLNIWTPPNQECHGGVSTILLLSC